MPQHTTRLLIPVRDKFKIADGTHSNSRIQNNIFIQEGSLPIAIVPTNVGLSFANNCWSKTPPSTAWGTGDVVGDPQLARSGQNAPGVLTPDWFKILAASPAQDKANVLPQVPRLLQTSEGTTLTSVPMNMEEASDFNLPGGLRLLSCST
jgi:hypothetical protein